MKKHLPGKDQDRLLDVPEDDIQKIAVRSPTERVWTSNKARLIERYLFYFLKVAKRGTYVDGFAAPHEPDVPDSWAARRVIESQPPTDSNRLQLRHFHLCDRSRSKRHLLKTLEEEHPERDIQLYFGDFNKKLDEILAPDRIKPKEATFCLLDQYTFECHWSTVEKIAGYQDPREYKVEQFYFLAQWWFARSKRLGPRRGIAWWGRDDYRELFKMTAIERSQLLCERFQRDLGYRFATPWPIYIGGNSWSVAYHMIHATDHPRAPLLMDTAYHGLDSGPVSKDQLALTIGVDAEDLDD